MLFRSARQTYIDARNKVDGLLEKLRETAKKTDLPDEKRVELLRDLQAQLADARKELADATEGMRRAPFEMPVSQEALLARNLPPTPAPSRVQKAPSEGFRLSPERGEPARPATSEAIAQRIASALARPDLSDETYAFLRRAENVLPKTDNQGVLSLLDKQLSKIEIGRAHV